MLRIAGCFLIGLTAIPLGWGAIDYHEIEAIFSENCYQCHGPDKGNRKGDLRLDRETDAKALHDDVRPIVPGKSAESEAIKRLLSTDPDEVMPPPKTHKKLTARQTELLRRWIDEGAKWGKHWSFEGPLKPAVPVVTPGDFKAVIGAGDRAILAEALASRNPLDAFVFSKLAREGLRPSPEASKETLIRRVTLDLTGLPPTLAEVDAFVKDSSPQAYQKVVDRLLESPRYGERWCWDWLDGARYADTNGYQGDPERTMWPWRDWVVKAINENMPFDQFTIWQIAGDLLPGATVEEKLATGFHRNHMINGEGGRIAEETRVEDVMDRVETTGVIWLGLTIGCCRCHDHKFDPLTLRDYYSFYDFFNQTSETGPGGGQTKPVLDMATPEELSRAKKADQAYQAVLAEVDAYEMKRFGLPPGKERADLPEVAKFPGKLTQFLGRQKPAKRTLDNLLECVEQLKKLKEADYAKLLERELNSLRSQSAAQKSVTKVMIMDTIPTLRDTFVLVKGAYDKPTADKVSANVPASLPPLPTGTNHDRLALARWLVSRENPLTARVTVNRFWQAFFGLGLVKTVEDFGVQGEKPVNQPLLDWLAVSFMNSGWDVKALHKLIVMSAAYRQSSKVTPQLYERDPENRLLARGPRFRLPSWMMRDQALFVAGLLQDKMGGPSVKPYQPEGIWEEATFGKIKYNQDHGGALYRRSLYTYWRRIVGPTMIFDNASRQTCYVRTLRTNTPLHALTTLNDDEYVESARVMAQRVMLANRDEGDRLDHAFLLTLARRAKPAERSLLLHRLELLKSQYRADPDAAKQLLAVGESKRDDTLDAPEHAAWTALCQLVMNLDEAITKE